MGYTAQTFEIFDNSTDANFRLWGSHISAKLASMGWAMTSDTGQVNWTTVTSPAAGVFVYEIWQPQDALQTGGTVFYVKVEYGSSSAGTKGPRFRVTVGTGTNGSGTLTGSVTSVFEATPSNGAGGGSVAYECNFSGDTDRLGLMLWRNLGNDVEVCIERTKNTDGTNSSDGVTIVCVGRNTSGVLNGQQTIVFGVGVASISPGNTFQARGRMAAVDSFNNNVPLHPVVPEYGREGNPMTTAAFINTADVAEGGEFSTTLYGATRTYIATAVNSNVVPNNQRFCMRYD